jgi:hypothetical protein
MPKVEFTELPTDARVWVFAASDVLSADAEATLLQQVDRFLAEWRAHGQPLACAREWREGRFLAIGVDQRTAGASGCSIDGLFRTLRELEPLLGTSLVAGGLLFWRNDDGVVERGTRAQFAQLAADGRIRADTRVFDTTVTTAEAWHSAFEQGAASSWHGRYLAVPPATGSTSR